MDKHSETTNKVTMSKKSPFEDLNKDELIQKCKGFLAIAQKAKQAKSDLQEEIENYKTELNKCQSEKKSNLENLQTLQELVDSLTEQKLNYITEVDSAHCQIKSLNEKCSKFEEEINQYKADLIVRNKHVADTTQKLSDLDNEIVSLKRQNKRLLDENEQFINQLTDLESQATEFNHIGLQQREQLKILEGKVQTDDSYKKEIQVLNNEILELKNKLELKNDGSENKKMDYENKFKELTQLYESERNKKEKANIKLRSYKDKILKCAACISQLKNSRFILSKTVKEYSESIPKWQNDIMKASKILDEQINELNNENASLKEKLQLVEKRLSEELMSKKPDNTELQNKITELQQHLNDTLKIKNSLEEELEKLKLDYKKLNEFEITQYSNDKKDLKDQLNESTQKVQCMIQTNSELQLLVENLKSELSATKENLDECSKSKLILNEDLVKIKSKYRDLHDTQLPTHVNEIESLKHLLRDVRKRFEDTSKENVELHILVDNLKSENQNLISSKQIQIKDDSTVESMILQLKALESEKAILVKEKLCARDNVLELENKNKALTSQLDSMNSDILKMKSEVETLSQEKLMIANNSKIEKESEVNNLKCKMNLLQEQYDILKKEHEELQDLNGLLKEEVETLKLSLEQPKEDGDNLTDLNVSLQADIVKLETKLAAYKQENTSLLSELKESRVKVKDFDNLLTEYVDAKSKLSGYKTENTELLNEMKEINQVLKERGETISKLQKAIAEMERLIETLEKDRDNVKQEKDDLSTSIGNLQEALKNAELNTDTNIAMIEQVCNERDNAKKLLLEKEALITSLKEDIDKFKQQQSSSDLPHDDMSTSTISRAEDHSRMKDLDETFEDKYTKLRIFALKLKKKLNETTAQLQQTEQDKVRIEKLLHETNSKDTKSISAMGIDVVDNSCKKVEDDILNLQCKVKTLTVESQETNAELEKLKVELDNKCKLLLVEIESHKVTKDNLEKARRDAKKKNVLSLEMEDYERSMKELTAKMDEKKKKMVQMESTIDTQEGTITSMKTQIKLLEEQIKTEETQNRLIREELQHAIDEGREKDNIIQVKNGIISKLELDLEDEKRKNEESDLEMTSLISEKEKIIMNLSEDKADLNNKVKMLEFKCGEIQEKYKITNIELADLKTEYTSYKVRAKSVLRQNQTVDHSQEEQLKEETAALKTQLETVTAKLTTALEQCATERAAAEASSRRASEAAAEAARTNQRSARLHADLTRLGHQLDAERDHHKLQTSTLTQCYKTQINELEAKFERDTEALRKQLLIAEESTKTSQVGTSKENQDQYLLPVIPKEETSDGEMDINVSMIPREEGEGSESAPSPPPSKAYLGAGSGRSPVPLERLLEEGVPDDEALDSASLALTSDQEIVDLRRRLQAQQQRVKHVTMLLSESERECARLSQLSDLLKSELRRVRSSPHQHNTEYMKNVTLKFLTLAPGDERSRLVPVLQKILTLTPDETQKIQSIAKGQDPNSKGWGSYLPWPGGK
ncbi:GRIP and coiled-coil domain-containing protein 2-like isoform X2 [Achroia grisella]|uniref:GRIP and coiled-coil domain-containing protein 2-like isoform X2 n=1 Tax=Achroia grisella TaxID=688607 RepID=UPI0027D24973|nr:GRIP and coiled-coil domain-containing protein 2-like isoform X2 [Achroia grisella]